MPDPVESPTRGFALSDFDIPDRPADDTPKTAPDGAAAPQVDAEALKTGTITEPEIKPMVDDDGKKPDEDDGPASLEGAMRDSPDAGRKEQERLAAEQKTKDDAAAETARKAAEAAGTAAPAAERDADLKHDLAAHRAPTRKVITDFQNKAKAARDERDRIAAEKLALQKERDELAEKLKAAPVPKELDDEVKTLRERVRELDITRDPVLEKKYDARIKVNNESIVEVLKSNGLGKRIGEDGKAVDDPASLQQFVSRGLTTQTIYPLIVKLRKSAEKMESEGNSEAAMKALEDADALHDLLRENGRVSREKQTEIDSWKADHGNRTRAREQETKQQAEARQAAFTQQTDAQYRAEIAALEKDFDYLKQPAAPLATDAPAVKAAKEKAIEEFNAAAKRIETEVKGLNPAGLAPEKMPELVGKINSQAILAIALKTHVLPSLKRDMAALRKERDEAVAELTKIRDAGRISRLHGQAPGTDPNAGKEAPSSLEDALRGAMPGA